jgi:hypothetical protein
VPGPPWWYGKLNHGKFEFHSPTRLMGLDLVVEGTRLKASSANDELKIGSWGEGGWMSICPKVTLHVALQNVFGANHGVVLGQHWLCLIFPFDTTWCRLGEGFVLS